MISYDEARRLILQEVAPLPQARVRIDSLLGSFLSQPVTAKFAMPRFDNSAVDGYGVLCADLEGASADKPSKLYIERCKHFQEAPPPEEWNGVWVMESK